jgi:DNA-binding transcriptional MerR regulator
MSVLITIGDFSKMTHLSVKALRHYHDVGLLEPMAIDHANGYRLYAPAQVPVALVIRRFRDLGMPIDEVRAVLQAPDIDTRNKVVVAHLERMETQLAETAATVTSLRTLLEAPALSTPVEYRLLPAADVIAITGTVPAGDIIPWLTDAFNRLRGGIGDRGLTRAGPDGALYPPEFFQLEEGEVVAFVPVSGTGPLPPGAERMVIAATDAAVVMHRGSFDDIDQTYAVLGTAVAGGGRGAEGPIREYYVVSPLDRVGEEAFRTEVAWPVGVV